MKLKATLGGDNQTLLKMSDMEKPPFEEKPPLEEEPHTGKKSMQEEFEMRRGSVVDIIDGVEVNASGHRDELARQYSIWSLCGLALTIDNAWVALGGSIAVSVANGGPPGVLYEFLVACFWYAFLGASIAEVSFTVTERPHLSA